MSVRLLVAFAVTAAVALHGKQQRCAVGGELRCLSSRSNVLTALARVLELLVIRRASDRVGEGFFERALGGSAEA
jgi:hypothetical protein